ncbi:MAG: hypothetical protein O6952_10610 [Planctomycetota bacterium]|nr:hypothetical protein [Planctomycetota bacterium]
MAGEWSDLPTRTPKGICAHCYSDFPKDEMERMKGALYCKACSALIRRKSASRSQDEEAAPARGAESPIIDAAPEPADGLLPPSEEEFELRAELLELERERKRRPEDVDILLQMSQLYEKIGDKEEASLHRDEYLRRAPVDSPARAKRVKREAPSRRAAPPSPHPSGQAEPFWHDIPEVLYCAIEDRGIVILLAGGAVLGTSLTYATFSILGYALSILVIGYIAAFTLSVIRNSASGGVDPLDWPTLMDPWNSIFQPLLAFLGCHIIPLAPFLLVLLVSGFTIGFNFFSGTFLAITFLAALIIIPMALMVYAILRSYTDVINVPFLFESIRKILPDYLSLFSAICVILSGKWIAYALVAYLVGTLFPYPLLGTLVLLVGTSTVGLYALLTIAHLIGHVYAQSAGRLDWFGREKAPERDVTLPVVAAGGGGALLVLVVGFVLTPALPDLFARATGADKLLLFDRTFLQYDVISASDSRRLRMRYEIEKVEGGYRFLLMSTTSGRRTEVAAFAVNREGDFLSTPPSQEGPIMDPLFVMMFGREDRKQTILCGPRRPEPGEHYVNTYPLHGEVEWRGWRAYKVKNADISGALYYDRSTGYLVGIELSTVFSSIYALLTDTDVPGLDIPEAIRRRG